MVLSIKTSFKKSVILSVITILISVVVNAQIYHAKEFSKVIALYKAKEFVVKEVLGSSNSPVKFQIDPLAAASSGELTSLVYKCEAKNKEGLALGFFGTYVNQNGVNFTAFAFKNFPKDTAIEFLTKIDKAIDENANFLNKDLDNNNFYLVFDDVTLLIYSTGTAYKIRLFWNGFDAEWNDIAFSKTKRRFMNKMN